MLLLDDFQQPSEEFWVDWRTYKWDLKRDGYRPMKVGGVWYITHLRGPKIIPLRYIRGHKYAELPELSKTHKKQRGTVSHPITGQLDPNDPYSQLIGVDMSTPPWD